MPQDTPTHSREGLIQVIAVRLDNLHADVSGMRDVLKELTTAATKLAVIEERQGQAAHAGPFRTSKGAPDGQGKNTRRHSQQRLVTGRRIALLLDNIETDGGARG